MTRWDMPDDIACIVAPNPSPMTLRGTNSYLVGTTSLCVIDPGPDDPAHLDALLRAIGPRRISHIVVTHGHLDHSGLARQLSMRVRAPVLGFGPSGAGRSAAMRRRAAGGLADGGEGIDRAFHPDVILADGMELEGQGWSLRAIHTPGHMGNHLCLRLRDMLFTGDHAMGWASSLVSPPEGDVAAYMSSCIRLLAEGEVTLLPGHGDPVPDGAARIAALLRHRQERERQIRSALEDGPRDIASLVTTLYGAIAPDLRRSAGRNVLAHLIDLDERGLVLASPGPAEAATYALRR
ncbi:MAG: MBL fold metallo-hydrolase [Rubellimicrobium sp.]|nr:MBL fold metallo-hydrolase [Rubellimicrobium sp.]